MVSRANGMGRGKPCATISRTGANLIGVSGLAAHKRSLPISRLENGPDFLPQHEGLVSGNLLGIMNPI
jgi:hypothetical protein